MPTPIRRVVTGIDAQGRSVVVSDDALPGGPFAHDRYVWVAPVASAVDTASVEPPVRAHRLEPQAGDAVFRMLELPPESATVGLSPQQREAFFAELFGSMDASHCRVDTRRGAGMHRTRSIDYVVVLRGEVTLMLDEGETTLGPGDVLVQRNTNHDWVVRGNEPALLAVVMIGTPAA